MKMGSEREPGWGVVWASDLVLVGAARGRSRRSCGSVLQRPGGRVSPGAPSPPWAPSRGWCGPGPAGRHPIITINPQVEPRGGGGVSGLTCPSELLPQA